MIRHIIFNRYPQCGGDLKDFVMCGGAVEDKDKKIVGSDKKSFLLNFINILRTVVKEKA